MNKIIVKSINSQNSKIIVTKNNIISKHIISNHGWFDLNYWIDYFENKY